MIQPVHQRVVRQQADWIADWMLRKAALRRSDAYRQTFLSLTAPYDAENRCPLQIKSAGFVMSVREIWLRSAKTNGLTPALVPTSTCFRIKVLMLAAS